jgi:hypothetical protein
MRRWRLRKWGDNAASESSPARPRRRVAVMVRVKFTRRVFVCTVMPLLSNVGKGSRRYPRGRRLPDYGQTRSKVNRTPEIRCELMTLGYMLVLFHLALPIAKVNCCDPRPIHHPNAIPKLAFSLSLSVMAISLDKAF